MEWQKFIKNVNPDFMLKVCLHRNLSTLKNLTTLKWDCRIFPQDVFSHWCFIKISKIQIIKHGIPLCIIWWNQSSKTKKWNSVLLNLNHLKYIVILSPKTCNNLRMPSYIHSENILTFMNKMDWKILIKDKK